jgi:ribonuclease HII
MRLSLLQRLQGQAQWDGPDPWWSQERSRLDQMWEFETPHFPGWVAGCDEVGRGPMAGPMVVAAAACKERVDIPGLNDSKKLSHEERLRICELILDSPIRVKLHIVEVATISSGNLHKLSLGGMRTALKALRIKPKLVLVDGKYPLPDYAGAQQALVKGDRRSALIAAASIVAKVTRDQMMHQLAQEYPGYGWEHNVGYPTEDHRQALLKLGPTPHHRLNYRPVKALLPTQLLLDPLH